MNKNNLIVNGDLAYGILDGVPFGVGLKEKFSDVEMGKLFQRIEMSDCMSFHLRMGDSGCWRLF